eukprot:135819_1
MGRALSMMYQGIQAVMQQIRHILKIQSKQTILIASTATGFVLLLIRNIYYRLQRRIYSYPRGPIGIPIFGSMFSALNFPEYSNYLYGMYGNTTMINIGSQRLVLLHSIDVINEVFDKKNVINRNYNNALHAPPGSQPYELNTVTVGLPYWSHKRRVFQSILLSQLNSSFVSDVHNYSLQTKIIKSINNCIVSNKLWKPTEDIKYAQFNVIWSAAFGADRALKYDDKSRHQIMECIANVFGDTAKDLFLRSVVIFRYILPQFVILKIFHAVPDFDALIESLIYKHLNDKESGEQYDELIFDKSATKWNKHFNQINEAKSNAKGTNNVIAKLIANYRRNKSKESTKMSTIGDICALFEAGVDTTLHTTEYALILLAKHEKIQSEIYRELLNVFGADWKMEKIDFSAVSQKLHLLRAFIYESIRLSSVVPLGVGHIDFDKDVVIENARDSKGNRIKCVVPKGTEFMANIPNANKNDEYWTSKANGKSADDLDLNLWLDVNGKFKASLNKNKMLSFGVGKRNCAGRSFAVRSLSVIFAKWILLYKFSLPQNMDKDTPIKQTFNFSMLVDPKIPIKVQKR